MGYEVKKEKKQEKRVFENGAVYGLRLSKYIHWGRWSVLEGLPRMEFNEALIKAFIAGLQP